MNSANKRQPFPQHMGIFNFVALGTIIAIGILVGLDKFHNHLSNLLRPDIDSNPYIIIPPAIFFLIIWINWFFRTKDKDGKKQ